MSNKNKIKTFFSKLLLGLDGFRKLLHLFFLMFIFLFIIGGLSNKIMIIKDNSSLVIAPIGNLVEQYEGDPYDRALSEILGDKSQQILVQDIIDSLELAKNDPRINSVVFELDGLANSIMNSKLERIAVAIKEFRKTSKPVFAFANYYNQNAYYLAAHANKIYMDPNGIIMFQGFGSYVNYYKNLIEKLKIDWNVFRVGTHKSAVEPFIRNDMSEEDRSSRLKILNELWKKYENDILENRSLSENSLTNFSQNLLKYIEEENADFAQLAKKYEFVDDLITEIEFHKKMTSFSGTDIQNERGYQSIMLFDYLSKSQSLRISENQEKNIAIIIASGEILHGTQPPGTIGGKSTARLLLDARQDKTVQAVVLRIDSPGGSAFASDQILNEIVALQRAGKPVVASMSSLAASGGYWIAMAADKILARETTITGSIGIFGMLPTFQRSFDAIGIGADGVGTSPWSREFRLDHKMSQDSKILFQKIVDQGYDNFITKVAKYRRMDKGDVDTIAQGQIWTGNNALTMGLIDQIGDLEESIIEAAKLAGIEEGYGQKYFDKELTPSEQFTIDFLSGLNQFGFDLSFLKGRHSPLDNVIGFFESISSSLLRFNDPKGIYAHCFCSLVL